MQSGYGEQNLSSKKFIRSLISLSKEGFVIFLRGATESDFFKDW